MQLKIIFLLTAIILISCGGYNTGVLQKDHKGFIKFTGNTTNVSVEINSESKFELDPETELYELYPGQYNIKVYRNNNLVVDRIIIIEGETTYEIEVP
jgi:hypothetical protein